MFVATILACLIMPADTPVEKQYNWVPDCKVIRKETQAMTIHRCEEMINEFTATYSDELVIFWARCAEGSDS